MCNVALRVQDMLAAAASPDENRLNNMNRPVYTLDEPEVAARDRVFNALCCYIPVIHPLRYITLQYA